MRYTCKHPADTSVAGAALSVRLSLPSPSFPFRAILRLYGEAQCGTLPITLTRRFTNNNGQKLILNKQIGGMLNMWPGSYEKEYRK
jgi:hypothetical protein